MEIRSYSAEDQAAVVRVWERCGLLRPWNDPVRDIERKTTVQKDLFLVGIMAEQVIATAMAGYDGHRGWINYLAVCPDHQRKGYGAKMVAEAERRLLELGCPKVNLQIRSDNVDAVRFYEEIGYTQDRVVSMGKRLISDET